MMKTPPNLLTSQNNQTNQAYNDQEKVTKPDVKIGSFMQKHWSSIRTFSKTGKVQSIFNFVYTQDLKLLILKIVNCILQLQSNRFKLNYSFAYTLRNTENLELGYYYVSYNNILIMSTARLIVINRQELIEFFNEESFFDRINRPDTKWRVVNILIIERVIHHKSQATKKFIQQIFQYDSEKLMNNDILKLTY